MHAISPLGIIIKSEHKFSAPLDVHAFSVSICFSVSSLLVIFALTAFLRVAGGITDIDPAQLTYNTVKD